MAQGGGLSVFIGNRGSFTVLAVAAVAAAAFVAPVVDGDDPGDTVTCDQTAANAAGLTSAISAASNGDTICLTQAVSYGSFTGTSKSVTIISQSGSGPPDPVDASMTINFGSGDTGAFVIDGNMASIDEDEPGLSINGGTLTTGTANWTLRRFKSTGCGSGGCRLFSATTAPVNCNCLIEEGLFYDVLGGEAVWYIDDTATGGAIQDTGITFRRNIGRHNSNDLFKLTGDDTVRMYGNACVDAHESHSGDGNHTDCWQFTGANHVMVGNLAKDADACLFGDDGTGNNDITNNVCLDIVTEWINVGGDGDDGEVGNGPGSRIHNNVTAISTGFSVFAPPNITCGNNAVNNGFGERLATSITSVKDNINRGSINLGGTGGGLDCEPVANTNNMLPSGASSPNFNGSPTFVGGSNPGTFTSFSDFCLSPLSSGYTGSSTGGQVGICDGSFDPETDGPPVEAFL